MSSSEVGTLSHLGIDRAKCQGHGRCYVLNPDLFTADDEGFGEALDIPVDPRAARSAALDCPEAAIVVTQR